MCKRVILSAAIIAACLHANAQTLGADYKGAASGNPISPCVFCADPTALEYQGRLYVYGTNDHQEFLKNGKKGDNSYGSIKSMVVFSTADMVNWTFHGTIDAQKLCSTWSVSGNQWYKGFMNSWAPSVTWRTNASTGKDEFFLYFANTSHGVGVLTANSPIGPWKSPLKQSLINKDTPGALQQSANFDPGVVIDDNGVGWLTFGGLDYDNGGTDMLPGNTRIIKLKPTMTAIDGKAVDLPAPYHFEANELNVIGGKYVFTYCSNWAQRKDSDWNKYKKDHGISASKPNSGTMCYMVAENPTDPASWVYKGEYGPHPGSSGNNHSHLQKFKDKYYHIYHNGSLLEAMKKANAVNGGGYRSICVNVANVNETTQTISKVSLNNSGAPANGNLNPFELQEAETMATCGGISYEDFSNITKVTSINSLGNDASKNMQVKIKAGAWTQLRKVDFGTAGASSFMLRAKGTGTLEVRINTKTATPAATVEFSSTTFTDHTIDVDPSLFNGIKTVFLVFTAAATNTYFDAWQFTENNPDAITVPYAAPTTDAPLFDMNGRRIIKQSANHGIYIRDGKKVVVK